MMKPAIVCLLAFLSSVFVAHSDPVRVVLTFDNSTHSNLISRAALTEDELKNELRHTDPEVAAMLAAFANACDEHTAERMVQHDREQANTLGRLAFWFVVGFVIAEICKTIIEVWMACRRRNKNTKEAS